MSHPNLSDDINHHLDDPERENDLDLTTVMPSVTVVFHTRNTRYSVTRLDNGLWAVEGNTRFFPVATACRIIGSTWGGSMIKINHIGVGMHVEMVPQEGPYKGYVVVTSPVVRIGDHAQAEGVQ